MPGFENHSHQLGSNPVETKAQLRSLTESAPLVKCPKDSKGGADVFACPNSCGQAKTPAPPFEIPEKMLFYFDRSAGVGELLLDSLGLVLADAFLDRLGSAIDQVFGFLQTE